MFTTAKTKRHNIIFPLTWMLLITLLLCGTRAEAASSAKYTYKKVSAAKTYSGAVNCKANVYFKKPVLSGKGKAIKKINQAIEKECQDFLQSESVKSLYESAQSYANEPFYGNDDMEMHYYATCKVTYNRKNVISIRIKTNWFAGGVSNTDVYGMTFSLKTGKKLTLKDVCKGSSSSIKKSIRSAIRKKDSEVDPYVINSYSVKKIDFYLKKNKKAVVCFGPYEISYGGWYRTYTIKSKYA